MEDRSIAEIAFEAGEQQGIVRGSILGVKDITLLSREEMAELNAKAEAYIQGIKQDGIREVVEWINGNIYFTDTQNMPRLFNVWKAKLRVWGVDKSKK